MTKKNIRDLSNATAYDSNNEKLGSVKEVFINDGTGQPDFVEVGHGLFGMNSSLVPLRGHRLDSGELRLAFPKEHIKDAPNLNVDAHLDGEQLDTLYRHYGLENTADVESYGPHGDHLNRDPRLAERGQDGVAAGGVAGGAAAHQTRDHAADPGLANQGLADSGAKHAQATDPHAPSGNVGRADERGELTRSEEQLNISKERETTGQARLRKYVVHDTETVEVPVEREEVRVERTPVDPSEAARLRGDLTEGETSVTLHEERVSATKESVPVEKVKLVKETVTDSETVSADLAREQIKTEGVDDVDPRNRR